LHGFEHDGFVRAAYANVARDKFAGVFQRSKWGTWWHGDASGGEL